MVHDLMDSRDLHEMLRSIRLDAATTELVTSVLVPSIDAQQRIHFSVLGYGDFLLMQAGGATEPGPATDPQHVPDGLGGVTTLPTGSRDSGGRDGGRAHLSEEPVTVSAFLRALLADFLDFAVNPLTLLVVGLLGGGYLAAQVALAREHERKTRARQRSKSGHASRGRRAPAVIPTHGAGKS